MSTIIDHQILSHPDIIRVTKAEAERQGMSQITHGYGTRLTSEVAMLNRCLADQLRAHKRVGLVDHDASQSSVCVWVTTAPQTTQPKHSNGLPFRMDHLLPTT